VVRVAPAAIALRTGDTAFVQAGGGTHSGRSLRLASLVMHEATNAILERARRIAAALFRNGSCELAFQDGCFRVKGTDLRLTFFKSPVRRSTIASCRKSCKAR